MNPLMFRLETEDGKELIPVPTLEGLVFFDNGKKIGVIRISRQLRPPFVKVRIEFDYQAEVPWKTAHRPTTSSRI